MITVFDIGHDGFPIAEVMFSTILLGGVACIFSLLPPKFVNAPFFGKLRSSVMGMRLLILAFGLFALMYGGRLLFEDWPRYSKQVDALRDGNFLLVEGILEKRDFVSHGRAPNREIFDIGNTRFEIEASKKYTFPGFFQTTKALQTLGGLPVRVAYLPENPPVILWVEVEKHPK